MRVEERNDALDPYSIELNDIPAFLDRQKPAKNSAR